MPSGDTPEVVVARWLRQNSYEKTLSSFLEEAGLPPDAGPLSGDSLTLEQLLEEKRLYDQSLNYEKRSEPTKQTWTLPAPATPKILSIPQASNVLHVSVNHVAKAGRTNQYLCITMADRRLVEVDAHLLMDRIEIPENFVEQLFTQDSPILCSTSAYQENPVQHIGTTMSGKVFIYTHDDGIPTVERIDHKRYCIKAALETSGSSKWLLATIGWDSRLNIYAINPTETGHIDKLDPPSSTLELPSIPEDILWIKNPNQTPSNQNPDHDNILILTRRDSCLLHYYLPTRTTPTLLGTQNLAPHALSWTVFTPSAIALCPTDATLLAVATSSLPHLRLILVKLLIPQPSDIQPTTQTPIFDARALLAKANKDEAAIQQHISTLAPQTPYSTPKVVWRPDGSGVWVNGDDGCVRGIEASSGKIVATLKGGHEDASKVRTLWAGYVGGGSSQETREEWVVSGGFDKRVVVWKVAAGK